MILFEYDLETTLNLTPADYVMVELEFRNGENVDFFAVLSSTTLSPLNNYLLVFLRIP